MRSTLFRSFSDLYNELKEEDMNISYNSLSECLNLVADQFTSFTELFNPLVSRAKLLANPLFRSDVMANDKLKKWGKGVLQKTKAMATLLSLQPSRIVPPRDLLVSHNRLASSPAMKT